MAEAVSPPAADEVKPYRIHIPTKHLDLTRQKLELTRLPHEPPPSDSNTWAPKPIIEPLIDYWLENYSWRTTESRLNTTIPQFRTAIPLPAGDHTTPVRIHFIHARSQQQQQQQQQPQNPTPLLLIPLFPLPALSLAPLLPLLTTATTTPPEGTESSNGQTFHVVIPSLPGTAFSDPLSSSSTGDNPVVTTAAIFDALMRRLGYERYLVSAAASASPFTSERIDERIVRRLVRAHGASCVGAHLVAPRLEEPRWRDGGGLFGEWGRWVVARVLKGGGRGGGVDGYERGDFEVLDTRRAREGKGDKDGRDKRDKGVGGGGLAGANTLAYALCDSPVGMLAFVLRGLRAAAGVGEGKGRFTPEELVTLASLMWLPGPEGMLRFWAACGEYREEEEPTVNGVKPRVAITVFTGAYAGPNRKEPAAATAPADDTETTGLWPTAEEVAGRKERYCPPAWARPLFDVVHTQRVSGPSSGLLAFEQPEVILAGIRGLAKAVLAKGVRLTPAAPLRTEAVVPAETGRLAAEAPVEQSEPVAAITPDPGEPSAEAAAVAPTVASETAPTGDTKGKGKEVELLAPPAKTPGAEDESPDTLVNTPLLERA